MLVASGSVVVVSVWLETVLVAVVIETDVEVAVAVVRVLVVSVVCETVEDVVVVDFSSSA